VKVVFRHAAADRDSPDVEAHIVRQDDPVVVVPGKIGARPLLFAQDGSVDQAECPSFLEAFGHSWLGQVAIFIERANRQPIRVRLYELG
jgi:hypothetical protein